MICMELTALSIGLRLSALESLLRKEGELKKKEEEISSYTAGATAELQFSEGGKKILCST